MSAWQPIETAPKDGTWILVYEPHNYEPEVHIVRWAESDGWPNGKTWLTEEYGGGPDGHSATDATHWMPLPDAPNKEPNK